MTVGHLAGVLVPHSRDKSLPLLPLLIAAQLGDLLWLLLAAVGVEPTTPASFLDVSMTSMQTHMLWSHALVPVLVEAALFAGVVLAASKSRKLALWCGALVIAHLVEDWLVGWKHEVLGAGSPTIGFGLYASAPYVAFAVEAAFSAALVTWYVAAERRKGRVLPLRTRIALYAVFVGGALAFAPNATHSMRQLF